MLLHSLKSKLLAGVCALVVCSGVLISLLVTHRYSRSLFEALAGQAEYLSQAIGLQAADMVLVNDLVALQKMLDHQVRSNPSLSYLFILKDGRVLAHTFSGGIPADLIGANEVAVGESKARLREIASTKGEYYLDIAMPIFDGKAGILRLGFSEKSYRDQLRRLWVQMTLLALGILFLAFLGSLFFVKRITGPLTELARAADEVDRGKLDVRVQVRGKDEVAALGTSFNHMISSLQTHTRRLEEQTMELERSHRQTRTFCGIVQEIGALHTIKEIGSFLIQKFQPIVESSRMAMMILNDAQDTLFIISLDQAKDLTEPVHIQVFQTFLDGLEEQEGPVCASSSSILTPPFIQEDFRLAEHHAAVPLKHEGRLFGLLLIACSGECRCNAEEVDVVGLMLSQAAGVIKRAVLHEEEIRDLQNRLESSEEFFGIVARDRKMQAIFKLIEDIAPTDASVLIESESGTGKELIARAIHEQSPRKDKPFIVIDCSAYPATLLEGELFGHEKGAFTGAKGSAIHPTSW
jgi:two-component system response regulator HydG